MSLKDTSKFLSLILRHKPETIGICLDEHGWANVNELIAGIAKSHEFYRSVNGMWLTKEVPVNYLRKQGL